jgi:prepilin-type N-terminal cleavage/methylation domain-containing protein
MKPRSNGFTIVEVIIVVIVIGILVGLGTFAFVQVQTNARNDQRAADTTAIADALEEYYRINSVYPSCSAMTQSAATVASLLKVDVEVLRAPTAASGTNSLSCALLTSGTGADTYAYVGDATTECTSNTFCFEFTLQYRQEGTGTIISKESIRCGKNVATGEATCSRPAS